MLGIKDCNTCSLASPPGHSTPLPVHIVSLTLVSVLIHCGCTRNLGILTVLGPGDLCLSCFCQKISLLSLATLTSRLAPKKTHDQSSRLMSTFRFLIQIKVRLLMLLDNISEIAFLWVAFKVTFWNLKMEALGIP